MRFVRSCRVFIGPSLLFDTDHRAVVMDIEFPSTKYQLHKQLGTANRNPTPKTKFQILHHCEDTRRLLTEKLDETLNDTNLDNIDELNEHITTTVRACVEAVCPKMNPTKKLEPWVDEDLQKMIRDLRVHSNHADLRKKQKAIKAKRRELKNKYYQDLANGINNAAEARQVQKEFALAKKYAVMKTSAKLRITNEKLKNHFQNHFAAREILLPPELEKPEEYDYLNEELIPINEEVPSEIELRTVLKSFKNNKSSGTDRLKTEGLKHNNSQQLINVLITLFTLIWTNIQVPIFWLHSSITCLYKKGSMSEAKNYRGLSIGANLSRIMSKIIMMRIQEAYEKYMGNEQFGFRSNRSTADGIFIVKQIIDKYGDTLVAVYIDLTAAYDHIPRDFLFRILSLRTGATHLIAIMKKMNEATTASMQ